MTRQRRPLALTPDTMSLEAVSLEAVSLDAAVAGLAPVMPVDLDGRADVERRPAGRRAATGRPLWWLRVADGCHRSLRRPVPIALDLVAAAVVVWALSSSVTEAAVAGLTFLVAGMLFGVWKQRSSVQAQGLGWYLRRVGPAVAVAAAMTVAVAGSSDRTALLAAVELVLVLTLLKLVVWFVVSAARRRGLGLSRTLVIGPERQVAGVEYRIHLNPEAGLVCAHSHVCSDARPGTAADSLALIDRLLADHSIDHIVCAGGDAGSDTFMRHVVRLAPPTVDVTVVSQVPLAGAPLTRLGDLAVICLARPSWGTDLFKRVFDVIAAGFLLIALLPVLLVTAVFIRRGDPGPAIFRQRRTGRENRMFTIFKFRSMVDNAESLKVELLDRNVADGLLFKAENDPRITRVGATIRRFSIDELPQLINVIRGEMSLVGPRPLPSVFDERDLFAQVRHRVLPGITGLWQVKGANALSYEDMIDLDCAYVATRSLGFDLRILLQTLPAVLVRRDPY